MYNRPQSATYISTAEQFRGGLPGGYRTLLDNSIQGVLVMSGRPIFVNEACSRMFGVSKEELLSADSVFDFYHPDERDRLRQFAALRQQGDRSNRRFEVRGLKKNGDAFWLEQMTSVINWNGTPAVQVVMTDIHDRKQVEFKLAQRENFYRELFQNAPVAMGSLSLSGDILQTNKAYGDMLGYSEEELVRVGPLQTVHPDYREAVKSWLIHPREDGTSGRELKLMRKDGRFVWALLSTSLIRDSSNGSAYVLAHFHDITARKNVEKQLFQMQKMEALGTLAGGIAHDFNNMLLPIIALTELTREEIAEESSLRENLDAVLAAANKASELVRRIMTFSRENEQRIDAIDISGCVTEALALLQTVLPSTIVIHDEVAADVGIVMADRAQLHSVIMNLCSNAADAMQDKGELTVALQHLPADAGVAALFPVLQGGQACAKVTIRDTGNGMDRATLDKIFEPFFTTKPVGKGTGLGLAMVHGIIESLGGAIDVSSEVNVGTTFSLYIPLAEKPAQ